MRRDYSQGETALNLQSLIQIVEADEDVSTDARRSRLCNLRAFARVIGKPPAAIPADVDFLRTAMEKANPGPAGISHEYWGMLKSSVWWALERAGVTIIRATGTELNAEWARFVGRLPWRPHRLTLAPLLKFCMEHDLSPLEFDQAAADRFRDWMKTGYRKRAWQRPYRRAVDMFMRCGREFPDACPEADLQVRFVDDHYTFKWSEASELEAEVDSLFAKMMQPTNRRAGNTNPVKASTARARKYYILRAASAIALTNGLDPSSMRLRDVINPDGIETFVNFVAERRNGNDRTGDLSQALGAFNAIARNWLKLDDATINVMVNIRRSVMPEQGPAEKNKRLMQDFRSPKMRVAFLKMPNRVIERLLRKEHLTDEDRAVGELAFTTAFLTCAPLRIGEFVALEKGVHIVDRGSRKNCQVVVHIPGEIRKVDHPLTFELSQRVIKIMDVHWERFRRGSSCETSMRLLPGFVGEGRNAHHLKSASCEVHGS